MKKPSKKNLKAKACKLFSKFIRQRDADWKGEVKCITCNWRGRWQDAHAGHYIHGKQKEVYFNEMNCHAQCNACNTYKGGERGRYAYMLIKKYGLKKYNELEKKRFIKKYWSFRDLQKIMKKYKKVKNL